jgi:hypothetical protein
MLTYLIEGIQAYLTAPKVTPEHAAMRVRVCSGCEHLTWAQTPFIARVGGYCGPVLQPGPAGTCGCPVATVSREGLAAIRAGTGGGNSIPVGVTIDGVDIEAIGKTKCEGHVCPLLKWV